MFRFVFATAVVFLFCGGYVAQLLAEPAHPDRRYLFLEDDPQYQKALRAKKQRATASAVPDSEPGKIKIDAPKVEYLQDSGKVKASQGAVLSNGQITAQADSVIFDNKTRVGEFSGGLLVNSPEGRLSATSGKVNLEDATGDFFKAAATFEDGGYNVSCEKLERITDVDYLIENGVFTTCDCPDGEKPWTIESANTSIREEGYGVSRNAWVKFQEMPIFYTPYLIFPAKREKQSGLLIPEFGYSSRDGFIYKQPAYIVLDESSDITLTPFLESKSRRGIEFDYRELFSARSRVEAHLLYSNESPRESDLRGTIVDDIFERQIDTNRVGIAYDQVWRSSPDAYVPLTFISDINYISDDLILRELEDERIGDYNARYLSSDVVLRASLGGFAYAGLSGQYTQSITGDDDLVFQRLPSFDLGSIYSFRPFGFNPYGLKVSTRLSANSTYFQREIGYDGLRANVNPSITVPFHYRNIVNGGLRFGLRQTFYDLNNRLNPGDGSLLEESRDRGMYDGGFWLRTTLERVFDIEVDSFWGRLGGIGTDNEGRRFTRLKHTVQPFLNYNYVPDISQDDLPFFDSYDRIRERSLFTAGVTSSLYGKFESLSQNPRGLESLEPVLPEGNELNILHRGYDKEIREITRLTLKQSYDYKEDHENNDLVRNSWSDLGIDLDLFASRYLALTFGTNIDTQEADPSSWSFAAQFSDDRGDALRSRVTYIENAVSQIEGNLEIAVTPYTKLGYYGRFDDRESEFFENKFGLRFSGSCRCWHMDLGYIERANPDREQFWLALTLNGLGEIGQKYGLE